MGSRATIKTKKTNRREARIVDLLDEKGLWARRDTDPLAREELINRYLGFAKSVAMRHTNQTEPLDDLIQVASLGLVNAVDRFDPDRGIPFVAFAAPTITGELKRHFRDRVSTMRLPRSLFDRIGQIDTVVADLTGQLNREPTTAEIAAQMSCSKAEVDEATGASRNRHTVSIDQGAGNDEDDSGSAPDWLGRDDPNFEIAESRIMLQSAMEGLSKEEKLVLSLRFQKGITQSEIAQQIGYSQMHVSRMLKRILGRMEDRLPTAA